jgi:hypothetical protein
MIVRGLLLTCCLILGTSSVMLAEVSPAPKPVAGGEQSPAAGVANALGCNSPEVTEDVVRTVGEPSIVQETGYGLQRKSWSPLGDTIQFTIKSFSVIPPNASVLVCFRWESPTASKNDFIEAHPSQLDLSSDQKQLNFTVMVPKDLGPEPGGVETVKLLPFLPLAEVRILAIDASNKLIANVPTEIGITRPLLALFLAIVAASIGLAILYAITIRRPQSQGMRKAKWYLQVISTKDGFGSLSQLQVLLWTFVVAISALYVMLLSGQLVEITSGTLVLLGIAGAVGVGAAIQNNAQINKAQTAAEDAAAASTEAQNAAEQAKAAHAAAMPVGGAPAGADPKEIARLEQVKNAAEQDATNKKKVASEKQKIADRLKNPPEDQTPKWSDLLINQTITDTGVVIQEIDVTRFQMLLFTLVTAVFVLITVVTTYVIPEIPSGFVTLMGISNGVYLGSKITQS